MTTDIYTITRINATSTIIGAYRNEDEAADAMLHLAEVTGALADYRYSQKWRDDFACTWQRIIGRSYNRDNDEGSQDFIAVEAETWHDFERSILDKGGFSANINGVYTYFCFDVQPALPIPDDCPVWDNFKPTGHEEGILNDEVLRLIKANKKNK